MSKSGPTSNAPKQERAVATRTAILEAAADAFITHGYADATLAKIRKNSNFTNGALYHHFPTREALALAVVDAYETQSSRIVAQAVESSAGPLESIIAVSADFAQALQSDRMVLAGVVLTTEVGSPISLRHPYEEWVGLLESLVVDCQAQGTIRSDVASKDVSEYMVSTFTGLQLLSSTSSGRKDILSRVRTAWRFVLSGLSSEAKRKDVEEVLDSVLNPRLKDSASS